MPQESRRNSKKKTSKPTSDRGRATESMIVDRIKNPVSSHAVLSAAKAKEDINDTLALFNEQPRGIQEFASFVKRATKRLSVDCGIRRGLDEQLYWEDKIRELNSNKQLNRWLSDRSIFRATQLFIYSELLLRLTHLGKCHPQEMSAVLGEPQSIDADHTAREINKDRALFSGAIQRREMAVISDLVEIGSDGQMKEDDQFEGTPDKNIFSVPRKVVRNCMTAFDNLTPQEQAYLMERFLKKIFGDATALGSQESYASILDTAQCSTLYLHELLKRFPNLRSSAFVGLRFLPVILQPDKKCNIEALALVGKYQLGVDRPIQYSRRRRFDPENTVNRYLVEKILKYTELANQFVYAPKYPSKQGAVVRFVKKYPFNSKNWQKWDKFIWSEIKIESPNGSPELHPVLGEIADAYGNRLEQGRESRLLRGNLSDGEVDANISKRIKILVSQHLKSLAPVG